MNSRLTRTKNERILKEQLIIYTECKMLYNEDKDPLLTNSYFKDITEKKNGIHKNPQNQINNYYIDALEIEQKFNETISEQIEIIRIL